MPGWYAPLDVMANPREIFRFIQRNSKRVGVSIVGFVVLAVGLVGLIAPVLPGWLLIIVGLAILSTEYEWARRALDQAKVRAKGAANRMRRKREPDPPAGPES
ncbi:MAG: PGPGW domain-containing protein [Actinomycetota bacterium]|nr:PGPGW domain-containing protein [Actinomycetota bacterium]